MWRSLRDNWLKNQSIMAFMDGLGAVVQRAGGAIPDRLIWAVQSAKLAGEEAREWAGELSLGAMVIGKGIPLLRCCREAGGRIARGFPNPLSAIEIRLLATAFKEGYLFPGEARARQAS